MAVRLRLKISVGDRSVEAVALLNSGYEASTPFHFVGTFGTFMDKQATLAPAPPEAHK